MVHSPPVEWSINQLREMLIGSVRQGPIPQHVAFVMDGNRRFARSHKIETVEGHNLGFEALAKILEVCYKCGVKVVTIYAFSIENFKRSKYEVDALMDIFKVKLSQITQHGDLLDRYGASVRILGQRDLLKPEVLEAINKAEKMTRGNGECILNVCFPYTSRDEMTTAIKNTVAEYSTPLQPAKRLSSETRITQKLRSRNIATSPDSSNRSSSPTPSDLDEGEFNDSVSSTTTLHPGSADSPDNKLQREMSYADPESIDAQEIEKHLFTAGTPPLDIMIRTSGVKRLSDFMLWQCHENTKLVFLDCLWPEFSLRHFLPVLIEWQWQRKYGNDQEDEKILKQKPRSLKA